MDETKAVLLNEVRYAERLCLRTARLYRRVQTTGVFVSVLAGSAMLSTLSSRVPPELSTAGAVCLGVFGALLLAVRPAERALANETDARRYAQIRTLATSMTVDELRAALEKARESDVPEIEPLRAVAYNDVLAEVGRIDQVIPLRPLQKVMAALA